VRERHLEEQLVEESVVAKANAGVEPDTVVVVAKGASLTNAAVVHSLELKILAFGAILHAFQNSLRDFVLIFFKVYYFLCLAELKLHRAV